MTEEDTSSEQEPSESSLESGTEQEQSDNETLGDNDNSGAEAVPHKGAPCGAEDMEEQEIYGVLTLDRIDNNKAHTARNCVTACAKCNSARGSIPFRQWVHQLAFKQYEAQGNPMLYDFTEKNRDVFEAFQSGSFPQLTLPSICIKS